MNGDMLISSIIGLIVLVGILFNLNVIDLLKEKGRVLMSSNNLSIDTKNVIDIKTVDKSSYNKPAHYLIALVRVNDKYKEIIISKFTEASLCRKAEKDFRERYLKQIEE